MEQDGDKKGGSWQNVCFSGVHKGCFCCSQKYFHYAPRVQGAQPKQRRKLQNSSDKDKKKHSFRACHSHQEAKIESNQITAEMRWMTKTWKRNCFVNSHADTRPKRTRTIRKNPPPYQLTTMVQSYVWWDNHSDHKTTDAQTWLKWLPLDCWTNSEQPAHPNFEFSGYSLSSVNFLRIRDVFVRVLLYRF